MQINREAFVQVAMNSVSITEVAQKLGLLNTAFENEKKQIVRDLTDWAELNCKGFEKLMERHFQEQEMQLAQENDDKEGYKEAKARLLDLSLELMDLGFDLTKTVAKTSQAPVAEAVTPAEVVKTMKTIVKKPKAKTTGKVKAKATGKVKAKAKKAVAPAPVKAAPVVAPVKKNLKVEKVEKAGVDLGFLQDMKRASVAEDSIGELRKLLVPFDQKVACEAIQGDILGMIPEGQGFSSVYCGRPVVLLALRPQLFGKEVVLPRNDGKVTTRRVTVHNGILNHCDLDEDAPSPYWSVLDAMSDLQQFNKAMVVERACKLHGEKRLRSKYPTVESFAKACSIAYDVLKTHHWHQRKRHAGMSHMVHDCGSLNKGLSEIRGRLAHESLEFFEEHHRKLEAARAGSQAPLASVEG
jgi:hypothetical protein